MVALLAVLVPLGLSPATAAPLPAAGSPSLPDRVGAPHWGTDSVSSSPTGPASVVIGGPTWWYTGSKGVLALVGAGRDDYRITENLADLHHAGEQAVLSPDGGRLATIGRVTDLTTGDSTELPPIDGAVVVPQAWSPDGRSLAVIAYTRGTPTAVLHLVDVSSGSSQRLADLDPGDVHDGYTVAFARDGARMAYQSGRTVTVATVGGQTVSRFTTGDRLSGKGAWTPDGQGLALLRQHGCCAGDAYPSRWQLTVVDAATGVARSTLPELTDLVAVRLLGWSPSGAAVVATLAPEPGTSVAGFGPRPGAALALTDYERVPAVQVVAIAPGNAEQTTLLAAPAQEALSIDVADNVISSGQVRTGHPPEGLGPILRALVTGAAVLVVGLTAVILVFRRRNRA
ncbi:hypothetical protein Ais01nite_18940 [Asanoa ishikariensis]|nr:hypothetical protein Ais01nite_18940 [Asanoa ishikariensis]